MWEFNKTKTRNGRMVERAENKMGIRAIAGQVDGTHRLREWDDDANAVLLPPPAPPPIPRCTLCGRNSAPRLTRCARRPVVLWPLELLPSDDEDLLGFASSMAGPLLLVKLGCCSVLSAANSDGGESLELGASEVEAEAAAAAEEEEEEEEVVVGDVGSGFW